MSSFRIRTTAAKLNSSCPIRSKREHACLLTWKSSKASNACAVTRREGLLPRLHSRSTRRAQPKLRHSGAPYHANHNARAYGTKSSQDSKRTHSDTMRARRHMPTVECALVSTLGAHVARNRSCDPVNVPVRCAEKDAVLFLR